MFVICLDIFYGEFVYVKKKVKGG